MNTNTYSAKQTRDLLETRKDLSVDAKNLTYVICVKTCWVWSGVEFDHDDPESLCFVFFSPSLSHVWPNSGLMHSSGHPETNFLCAGLFRDCVLSYQLVKVDTHILTNRPHSEGRPTRLLLCVAWTRWLSHAEPILLGGFHENRQRPGREKYVNLPFLGLLPEMILEVPKSGMFVHPWERHPMVLTWCSCDYHCEAALSVHQVFAIWFGSQFNEIE